MKTELTALNTKKCPVTNERIPVDLRTFLATRTYGQKHIQFLKRCAFVGILEDACTKSGNPSILCFSIVCCVSPLDTLISKVTSVFKHQALSHGDKVPFIPDVDLRYLVIPGIVQ